MSLDCALQNAEAQVGANHFSTPTNFYLVADHAGRHRSSGCYTHTTGSLIARRGAHKRSRGKMSLVTETKRRSFGPPVVWTPWSMKPPGLSQEWSLSPRRPSAARLHSHQTSKRSHSGIHCLLGVQARAHTHTHTGYGHRRAFPIC